MNQTIKIQSVEIPATFTADTYFDYCQAGGRLDLLRVAALQWYQCCLILAATTELSPAAIREDLAPTDRDAGESIAAAIHSGWADFLGPMIGSGLADEDIDPAPSGGVASAPPTAPQS